MTAFHGVAETSSNRFAGTSGNRVVASLIRRIVETLKLPYFIFFVSASRRLVSRRDGAAYLPLLRRIDVSYFSPGYTAINRYVVPMSRRIVEPLKRLKNSV